MGRTPQTSELTEYRLLRWILLFYRHAEDQRAGAGRCPTPGDKTVWDFDEQGNWCVVPNESWTNIDWSMRNGKRGLKSRETSLMAFQEKRGLLVRRQNRAKQLTQEQIVQWMIWHYQKEDAWPTNTSAHVWLRDPQGVWSISKDENWASIDMAIYRGGRGLKHLKGKRLPDFVRHHLHGPVRPRRKIYAARRQNGGFQPAAA